MARSESIACNAASHSPVYQVLQDVYAEAVAEVSTCPACQRVGCDRLLRVNRWDSICQCLEFRAVSNCLIHANYKQTGKHASMMLDG